MFRYRAFLIVGRMERYSVTNEELLSAGIEYEIIEAVFPVEAGRFKSAALRGCTESHVKALNIAGQSCEGEHALVMEDDVFFSAGFNDLFPQYLERIEKLPDWDMVYFYCSSFPPTDFVHLYYFPSLCCHFYLVNKLSLSKIARIIEEGNDVVDLVLYNSFVDRKLSSWSVAQQLVMQNIDFKSDLDTIGINYARENNLHGIYQSRTKYRKEHP